MKKIILPIAIILLAFLSISSCKKGSSQGPGNKKDTTNTTPQSKYYVTYKVNGVAVTATEISAVRGAASDPRTLTITATGKDGASPKLKFYTEEPSFGFTGGTSIKCETVSYPTDYVEYTNGSNVLYSTKNDQNGMYFDYLNISYKNGGEISGVFDGSISTDKGVATQITDGKYDVTFSN